MSVEPMAKPRILIADNSTQLAYLLALAFEDAGCQTSFASTIAEACLELKCGDFDLVLTDSFAMRAGEVLDATRPIIEAAGVAPVLLVTGHVLERESAIAAGFREIVPKPFDLDWLITCAQELLQERAATRNGKSAAACDRRADALGAAWRPGAH